MSVRIMDPAAKVLADPKAYSDEKRLHEALAHLRAHAPVSWVDVPHAPFWAITKHTDVMDIERDNELFTNDPRPSSRSPSSTRSSAPSARRGWACAP